MNDDINQRYYEFIDELKALFKKYNVNIHKTYDYEDNDNDCEEEILFVIDGYTWHGESSEDVIERIVYENNEHKYRR